MDERQRTVLMLIISEALVHFKACIEDKDFDPKKLNPPTLEQIKKAWIDEPLISIFTNALTTSIETWQDLYKVEVPTCLQKKKL